MDIPLPGSERSGPFVIDPDPAPTCPTAERLAAFVERRLQPGESFAIEAHLTGCDECRRQFADISALLDQPFPGRGVVPEACPDPAGRLAGWPRGRTARIAAAAMLPAISLTVALARPDLNPFRQATPYETLAMLAGTPHVVEGRLTDVPRLASVRRSPERRQAGIREAIARIRERAAGERSADNLRALGVAQVLTGAVEAGTETLQDAAAQAPHDARVQSDLSAALHARASTGGRVSDYPKALAAAERAIAIDPSSPAAHFNRALCLSVLQPGPEALEAWSAYLARDDGSRWADEARRRLRGSR